jgi:hypothetical protein
MYLLVPLAIVIGIYFWRVADVERRARFLRRTGLVLTGVIMFFFGVFVVGETLADPGGGKGVGLVSIWLVPLMLLSVAAWLRPGRMVIPLAVLSAAMVGLAVWFAVDGQWWRDYEDRIGPVRTIAMFVVATAISFLGRSRPIEAGVLLLVATAVPMLITEFALAGSLGMLTTALMTVGSPYVVIALLYLGSAAITRVSGQRRGTGVPHRAA